MSDGTRPEPPGKPEPGDRVPRVERVGFDLGRRVRLVAMLAAVLVSVAISKPWGVFGDPAVERPERSARASDPPRAATPPTPPATGVAAALPAASRAPPIEAAMPPGDPDAFHCLGYPGWLFVADETQSGERHRSWSTLDVRIGVAGPDDPDIPWIRLAAPSVPAIGLCVPDAPPMPVVTPLPAAGGWSVRIWAGGGAAGGAGLWSALSTRVVTGDLATAGGLLLAPAPRAGAGGVDGGWERGRYVVEVRPEAAGVPGPSAWFGVEIARPLRDPGGSPLPEGSAGLDGTTPPR